SSGENQGSLSPWKKRSLPPFSENVDRLVDAGSTSGSEACRASLSTSISVAVGYGPKMPLVLRASSPGIGRVSAIPASYRKPGYTWVPYEFLGPAKAFLMAAIFSGAMQPSLWPFLQASTAGSKSQPI